MSKLLYVVIAIISVQLALSNPTNDLVSNLPGYNYSKGIYSGFLDVNESKSLHYIFLEASEKADEKPVVLYLGGGPGCTSMYNLFNDLGPLLPNDDYTKFTDNEFAWTQYVNLLFVDAPAGVGYSKTNTLYTDDDQSAADNLKAVLSFFTKFPNYKSNEFHITGISYAGIYVPMLANAILVNNLKVKDTEAIRLKGILVGNPYTDTIIDGKSIYEFSYQQGLYSTNLYESYKKECDGVNPPFDSASSCGVIVSKIRKIYDRTNIYDIHSPCFQPPSTNHGSDKSIKKQYLKSIRCFDLVNFVKYMNLDSVKSSLNVSDTGINFDVCNDKLYERYKQQSKGSIYLYKKLINSGLRIFVLSGDVDAIVNYQGTQQWIYNLNLLRKSEYRKWTVEEFDVSGFVYEYQGLTYVTFKGAGHMATLAKKAEGFKLLKVYLKKEDF